MVFHGSDRRCTTGLLSFRLWLCDLATRLCVRTPRVTSATLRRCVVSGGFAATQPALQIIWMVLRPLAARFEIARLLVMRDSNRRCLLHLLPEYRRPEVLIRRVPAAPVPTTTMPTPSQCIPPHGFEVLLPSLYAPPLQPPSLLLVHHLNLATLVRMPLFCVLYFGRIICVFYCRVFTWPPSNVVCVLANESQLYFMPCRIGRVMNRLWIVPLHCATRACLGGLPHLATLCQSRDPRSILLEPSPQAHIGVATPVVTRSRKPRTRRAHEPSRLLRSAAVDPPAGEQGSTGVPFWPAALVGAPVSLVRVPGRGGNVKPVAPPSIPYFQIPARPVQSLRDFEARLGHNCIDK